MGIFIFGTILIKNLLKTSATTWSSEIYLLLPYSRNYFFSISVILDFICILSVNKGFTVFQNVLLSVMSRVLILWKFFFFRLIKLTQRLHCLLYAFVFCRILSLPLMPFYENLTTLFLMSQNFERILVCSLLWDQYKRVFLDF